MAPAATAALVRDRHVGERRAAQHPFRALQIGRQHGAGRHRVEADRRADLRIPEIGIAKIVRPRALDDAREAVLALRRQVIAARAENQHVGAVRDRRRRRAARQRDLVGIAREVILRDRRHGGVGRLRGLRRKRSHPGPIRNAATAISVMIRIASSPHCADRLLTARPNTSLSSEVLNRTAVLSIRGAIRSCKETPGGNIPCPNPWSPRPSSPAATPPISPTKAPSTAPPAPRCSPRRSSCAAISNASPPSAALCRRAAQSAATIASKAKRAPSRSPISSAISRRSASTATCSARSASDPARCAPICLAPGKATPPTSPSACRSRWSRVRRWTSCWRGRASAAGRTCRSTAIATTTIRATITASPPRARTCRASTSSRAATARSAISGAARWASTPPTPVRTPAAPRTSAPLWAVLDMTPEGRGADWYPKLDY